MKRMRSGGWRIAFLVVLTIAACTSSPADEVDWSRVHDVTMRGINLLYSLEMERAITTFDTVMVLAPRDPRGRFFRSMVHFWVYILKNDESAFNLFIAHSDTVVALCEQLVEQNPSDAVSKFYLGGMRGYRGLAQQLHGSMLKAVMEGREGYLHLEDAVRMQPQLSDAHMGFGIFRYLAAKVPRGLGWIVKLLGFDGDREEGLKSLRFAATNGVYTRSEAMFYLAQFLYQEHEADEALVLLKSLIAKHPENTLFHVLYASWQFRQNRHEEALAAIRTAQSINSRKTIRYGEEFIYSTRATILYSRNDFAGARADYDRFLEITKLRERVPDYTFYRIAVAREIVGDRRGAIEACGMMKSATETGQSSYMSRKARELAQRPLTSDEVLLIKAGNAMSREDPDSALHYFRAAANASDRDVRARALYGIQEALFDQDKDAEAIEAGTEVTTITPVRETWLIPHAYYRMARSYARLGKKTEALAALDRAETFDDYDFQSRLEESIEEERKKLEES